MAFEATAHTWMDLENIMLIEISQTETEKYCVISLMCGIIKQIKKHNRTERTIDTENKQVAVREESSGLMREMER